MTVVCRVCAVHGRRPATCARPHVCTECRAALDTEYGPTEGDIMPDPTPAEAACTCAPQWPGHECIVRTPAEEAAAAYLNEWSVRLYDGEIRELLTIVRPIIEAEALSAAARVLADCAARHRARQALGDPSAMSPGEIGGMETAASAVAQLAEDATIRGMAARGGDGRG